MKPTTFKKSCNKISVKLLGFECFDSTDSYDLNCLVEDAMKNQETPSKFVRRVFDEDLHTIIYDKYLQEESLKQYDQE